MPKRKPERTGDNVANKHPTSTCISHVSSINDHGHFTSLDEIKGSAYDKLQQLQQIRDRRLCLPHNSSYKMQAVCEQIPAELPDDLKSIGYHRTCYQQFSANLNRLPVHIDEDEASTSQWHHSPRKMCATSSMTPIFPPECIFCDKVEIKGSGRKTERAEVFSSWNNKENGWEQIESRAERMGLDRLHRQVQNKYLFAVEAKHHTSCLRSFRTAFFNYERGIDRAERRDDTEHARLSAAHEKALLAVLENIQTRIVQQNEVMRLTSLRLIYVDELKQTGYDNSNYRTEKLLKRLENDAINDCIHFTKVDHEPCHPFWLVHSSSITVSSALE